jgi:hypothetical protein
MTQLTELLGRMQARDTALEGDAFGDRQQRVRDGYSRARWPAVQMTFCNIINVLYNII